MSKSTACTNMIKQQLRTGNVLNERILALYEKFPREDFVPSAYASLAYSDMQIPLAHEQRMMTPLEEGLILQSLALTGHETVLEVGTGTGFFTALLSQLCKKVISVDYFPEFTKAAQKKLAEHGCDNVELVTGNGSSGWLEKAPYDVVIFTGALTMLTETHFLQVLPGGKMLALVGSAPVIRAQMYELDHAGVWSESLIFETNVPPLLHSSSPHVFVF